LLLTYLLIYLLTHLHTQTVKELLVLAVRTVIDLQQLYKIIYRVI